MEKDFITATPGAGSVSVTAKPNETTTARSTSLKVVGGVIFNGGGKSKRA